MRGRRDTILLMMIRREGTGDDPGAGQDQRRGREVSYHLKEENTETEAEARRREVVIEAEAEITR